MVYYESLLLLQPAASQEFIQSLKEKILETLDSFDGELKIFDKWGKYLLAYKIAKHSYGVYVLVRFGIPEKNRAEVVAKLKTIFGVRFHEEVLRFVIVLLGKNFKENYCRPDSLEDAPRHGGISTRPQKKNQDEQFSDQLLSESELLPDSSSVDSIDLADESNEKYIIDSEGEIEA